ncbi:MAG: MBL fold metallo-hydrolase [Albidovulum sp.]|nr:MBL fold metallo-hydrolase [Albidovulum sp.]
MMTAPTVEIIIQPVCLRFRLHEDELVYLFAAGADQQLDRMEQMLGVAPGDQPIFKTNVGFLPVASTVLLRGEKTLLIDPGNHHVGAYAILWHALRNRGLDYSDIDAIVTTHAHSDHAAAITQLPGAPWILGAGELEEMASIEGAPIVEAKKSMMGAITELETEAELMPGVTAFATPGHTAGHISLLVETDEGRVLVAGDLAMLRSEYTDRKFSQWYSDAQLDALHKSLDRAQALNPDLVIPGHDRIFRP